MEAARKFKMMHVCSSRAGFLVTTDSQTPESSKILLGGGTKHLSGITFLRAEGRSFASRDPVVPS